MASQPGFTVFFVVALLNFFGSVIQGVAGIGDAIFLQVMWAIAASANKAFEKTPLGTESVKVVALIMYIRLLFMSPLIVYLGLSDSIFSKQMVIMMAIPSTILSVVGVWLLPYAPDKLLKQLLAYSSFFFAFVYGCILVKNQYLKSSQLAKIKEKNIVITEESDAIKKEAQMAQDPGLMSMHASFVMNTPRGDILSNRGGKGNNDNHNSALNVSQSGMNSSQQLSNGSIIIQHVAQERSSQLQNSFTFPRNNRSFVSGHFSNNNYAGSVTTIDPDTGLQEGTTEAFMSTTGGGIFSADEARIPHPTEDNAPPLSPGKLSPLATLTYTRVRINRNLDENGKIKMTTKIGAAVAASVAGIMTSLTGVNAPPQIIFILLFDAPNYIVRVNFSAQSIPSNVLRFILGIPNGLFSWDQIPLFLDVVVFGFAGVVVGNHVGRMLGPNAFNYFVLCLLLLSALSMVTKNLYFLVPCVVFTAVTTVGFAYYENKQSKAKVDEQRVQELEIEQRVYDVYEDLIRNNNSFVGPGVLQGLGDRSNQEYNHNNNHMSVSVDSEGMRKKVASFQNLDNDDMSAENIDMSGAGGKPFEAIGLVNEPTTALSESGIAHDGERRTIPPVSMIDHEQPHDGGSNHHSNTNNASSSNLVVHQDVLGSSQSSLDSPPREPAHTMTGREQQHEEEEPPTEAVAASASQRQRGENYDPLYDDDSSDDVR